MTESTDKSPPAIRSLVRVLLVAAAAGLAVPLVIACFLSPSPRGHGTHQQLGLPPCSFKQMVGRRCPSCGMTTAFSHMARGEIVQAARANSAGAMLAVAVVMVVPWMAISGVRGRWLWRLPSAKAVACFAAGFILVTLVDWIVRLTLFK